MTKTELQLALAEATKTDIRGSLDLRVLVQLKQDSRRQQFTLQHMGPAWGEVAAQERDIYSGS